jgi:hypothetical protein
LKQQQGDMCSTIRAAPLLSDSEEIVAYFSSTDSQQDICSTQRPLGLLKMHYAHCIAVNRNYAQYAAAAAAYLSTAAQRCHTVSHVMWMWFPYLI